VQPPQDSKSRMDKSEAVLEGLAILPYEKCTDWKYFGLIEIDPNGILSEDLNEIITEIEENGFWMGGGSKTQFSEWMEKN